MGNIGADIQNILTGIQGWQLYAATLAGVVVVLLMVCHVIHPRTMWITLAGIFILFSVVQIVQGLPGA